MKKTDSVALTTAGIGAVLGVGVWIVWPGAPWYIFLAVVVGTLIAIPNAIKDAAEQKAARKILDE